ncbi:MAG: quinone-interacting membrane-bound oxidoreductase complex subunit QmoC [Syntrophorhabdales bacterium]|jgi:quinone-modifying oxidoreductase subunit QmoC
MSRAVPIEPDTRFIRDLKASGGDALKKCFQCATCSVVCNLSPAERPFPRKEMVWAQWGLKERLKGDPDIWLCHQCNDCSKYCPRGARPGDVMAALRRRQIEENAAPRFLGRMVNDPRFLPVIFAFPVVLLLLLMSAAGTLHIPQGEIIYRNFIPQWPVVDVLFPLTALWAALSSALGVRRLWTGFEAFSGGPGVRLSFKPAFFVTLSVLTHKYFKECLVDRMRYFAHFNIMWGFILLGVTTTSVAAGVYLFHEETPYALTNPIKWIGNLGGLALIAGSLLAIFHRLLKKTVDGGKGTYFDWLFLLVVLSTGITGLLAECLRLADVAEFAYPVYFVHLVFVWLLFASLPFSKFAHFLYRLSALVFAQAAGRELSRGALPYAFARTNTGSAGLGGGLDASRREA